MKILVFLDNPSNAHEIVRFVGQMALNNEDRLEVHLSRVLDFGERADRTKSARGVVGAGLAPGANGSWPESPQKSAPSKTEAADEYLARLAHRYLAMVPTKRVVFGSSPAMEILTYANRENISLIAIADEGERGIGRMLLSSGTVPLLKVPCEKPRR